MDEYQRLMALLKQNASKTFVQRILRPNDFPVLPHDGGVATHRMAWGEANGKFVAFPTVLYDGKQLVDYGPQRAFPQAMQSGNFIEFDNARDAEWFTKRYKEAWGGRQGYLPEWEQQYR